MSFASIYMFNNIVQYYSSGLIKGKKSVRDYGAREIKWRFITVRNDYNNVCK